MANGMASIIPYLLSISTVLPDLDLRIEYVLTRPFQTDNTEGRFRRYRQLSDSAYRVSVGQVSDTTE